MYMSTVYKLCKVLYLEFKDMDQNDTQSVFNFFLDMFMLLIVWMVRFLFLSEGKMIPWKGSRLIYCNFDIFYKLTDFKFNLK